jgi:hypothetical protein
LQLVLDGFQFLGTECCRAKWFCIRMSRGVTESYASASHRGWHGSQWPAQE